MKEVRAAPLANPFGAVSEMWMSACLQPWSAWQTWTEFWTGPWKSWLENVGSVPAPWLPALAGNRHNQPAAIDLFLPWLPHVEAFVKPLEGQPGSDALRVMLRAALPQLGSLGADWLTVDAVVAKGGTKAAQAAERTLEGLAVEKPAAVSTGSPTPAKRVAKTASKPVAELPAAAAPAAAESVHESKPSDAAMATTAAAAAPEAPAVASAAAVATPKSAAMAPKAAATATKTTAAARKAAGTAPKKAATSASKGAAVTPKVAAPAKLASATNTAEKANPTPRAPRKPKAQGGGTPAA